MKSQKKSRIQDKFQSTVRGFGALLDIGPVFSPRQIQISQTPWLDDFYALSGDWNAVGLDLKDAMMTYEQQLASMRKNEEKAFNNNQ